MESVLNESDCSVKINDQRIRLDFKANRNIYLCTLVNSLVVVVSFADTINVDSICITDIETSYKLQKRTIESGCYLNHKISQHISIDLFII